MLLTFSAMEFSLSLKSYVLRNGAVDTEWTRDTRILLGCRGRKIGW
jgi:hypothetical protein